MNEKVEFKKTAALSSLFLSNNTHYQIRPFTFYAAIALNSFSRFTELCIENHFLTSSTEERKRMIINTKLIMTRIAKGSTSFMYQRLSEIKITF